MPGGIVGQDRTEILLEHGKYTIVALRSFFDENHMSRCHCRYTASQTVHFIQIESGEAEQGSVSVMADCHLVINTISVFHFFSPYLTALRHRL